MQDTFSGRPGLESRDRHGEKRSRLAGPCAVNIRRDQWRRASVRRGRGMLRAGAAVYPSTSVGLYHEAGCLGRARRAIPGAAPPSMHEIEGMTHGDCRLRISAITVGWHCRWRRELRSLFSQYRRHAMKTLGDVSGADRSATSLAQRHGTRSPAACSISPATGVRRRFRGGGLRARHGAVALGAIGAAVAYGRGSPWTSWLPCVSAHLAEDAGRRARGASPGGAPDLPARDMILTNSDIARGVDRGRHRHDVRRRHHVQRRRRVENYCHGRPRWEAARDHRGRS